MKEGKEGGSEEVTGKVAGMVEGMNWNRSIEYQIEL